MHARFGARVCAPLAVLAALAVSSRFSSADGSYQQIPYAQDWSNTAMIQVDDDWSQVPGVTCRYGPPLRTGQAGLDPRMLTSYEGMGDTLFANRVDPNSLALGGAAEFDALPDPVVALQPVYRTSVLYLQFHLNTTGYRGISISYRLRDIDGSTDNSVQSFVLQYRLGTGRSWSNVDGTYVADATSGPNLASLETWIHAALPAICDNVDQLQLRILTTNAAASNDEWVGVDDFTVTGTPLPAGEMGVDLGWSACATTAATASRAFDCADNGAGFPLVGSFKVDFDVPDFVGVSAFLDVSSSAPTLPAWFQFGGGACREGALTIAKVGAIAGCVNPYANSEQGGGYAVLAGATPGQARIWLDWARDTPGPISAAARHTAFVLNLGTAGSIDEGYGSCDGCQIPACFVLSSVEVYSLSQGLVRIIQTPDERNWAAWQSGTASCPGAAATPVRRSSWGAVKALYR